jgi:hypothetical protein
MNILFCIGEYYPYMSPNGKMAMNIIDVIKNKHSVFILTRKNHAGLEKEQMMDDTPVFRINDFSQIIYYFLNEKISMCNNKAVKCILVFLSLLRRILFVIPRILRNKSISGYYIQKILNALYKIDNQYGIDIIIVFSAPHDEVFACIEYHKKNGTDVIVYQMDKFSDSKTLYACGYDRTRKKPNNMKLEAYALSECRNLFILPSLHAHFKEDIFKEYSDKIVVTEHPLVKIENIYTKSSDRYRGSKARIVYAGAFYRNLREPNYLLEMLYRNMDILSDIVLDIYSFGNCQTIISEYQKKIPEILCDHGRVSSAEITDVLASADILLTVGNNSHDDVPSKVFEYISYRKPIVHLYYLDGDAYIKYLTGYPYSICLKMDMDNIIRNGILFRDFCMECRGKAIDGKLILDMYKTCTPEYVSGQILDSVERKCV